MIIGEGKKRKRGEMPVREWIVRRAREKLQKIATLATDKNKKTLERFEKELETERQSLIDRSEKVIEEQNRRVMQSILKGYELREQYRREEAKQRIGPEASVEAPKPKLEASHRYGNPFKTDGHGQLLGEETDDGDYLRSPNVRRIYGRKG